MVSPLRRIQLYFQLKIKHSHSHLLCSNFIKVSKIIPTVATIQSCDVIRFFKLDEPLMKLIKKTKQTKKQKKKKQPKI